ncbi:hypothetical protein PBRA_004751 [Plasmodiophora brassicae]|uniref:Uncharacterized protein n=1 Tax=Plasmodiophora brassicae TaxID=37360 RepID=A0A0G4ILI5_PLABS|nr:hypothetical protein PBRA_004751 [Plasmodiophora brassicae]
MPGRPGRVYRWGHREAHITPHIAQYGPIERRQSLTRHTRGSKASRDRGRTHDAANDPVRFPAAGEMMGVIALSHLAPFSYINRGTLNFLALAWTVMHILSTNKGFGKINLFSTKYRNIRSCIAWLTILALIFCLIYDIMNTYVKYREGFLITSRLPNGNVFVKPAVPTQWSAGDLALLPTMTELLNLAFTTKSSAHFLGLAFWSTMAKKNFGTTFGSSSEFMAYKAYSVISIILYPIAEFTAPTETLSIIEPQLVYACENVVVMVLILAVNHRLVALLNSSSLSFDIQNRMKFYIAVNRAQFFFVLLEFLGLGSINIDQASKSNLLYASPFWTDFVCLAMRSTVTVRCADIRFNVSVHPLLRHRSVRQLDPVRRVTFKAAMLYRVPHGVRHVDHRHLPELP